MKDVHLFVEGDADKKFLQDLIKHITPGQKDAVNIDICGGWTKLHSKKNEGEAIRNQMKKNSDNDIVNLVIFDADIDFNSRKEEILEWRKKYQLDFELFLLPDNNSSGNLETLLEQLFSQNNRPIIDCWDGYLESLRSKTLQGRDTPLTLPPTKAKIYAYLETLAGESKSEKEKIKEKNRDYLDHTIWNLDSHPLSSLKSFLKKVIL